MMRWILFIFLLIYPLSLAFIQNIRIFNDYDVSTLNLNNYCNSKDQSTRIYGKLSKEEEKMRESLKKADRYMAMKKIKQQQSGNGSNLNDNINKTIAGGYKKLVGKKGSLDQRLRNVIAYKRATIVADANVKNTFDDENEEEELENLVNSIDGDDDYVDDEEVLYETLIQEILEKKKLAEIQRNFLVDKAAQKELSSENLEETNKKVNNNSNSTSSGNSNSNNNEDDLYTPARTSWGVFQRPRDITKAYGGGKVITKEQMRKQDEEYEELLLKKKSLEINYGASIKVEKENESKIRLTLVSARGYMRYGNCKKAVQTLEEIESILNWQTELGGEAYLELGMALETVDRSDDARNIYGQLVSKSRSLKIRRNSLQLLQGLDITKQLRKQVSSGKPILDPKNMYIMSNNLRAGLTNEWADYKKKDIAPARNNEVFNEMQRKRNRVITKVEDFPDALYLLRLCLDPLQIEKISSSLIGRAFRKIYLTSDDDKLLYMKSRMSSLYSQAMESYNNKNNIGISTGTPTPMSIALKSAVNGTWDLTLSWSDLSANRANRGDSGNNRILYESGSVRRDVSMDKMIGTEFVRVFFGFSEAKYTGLIDWNPARSEFTFNMDQNRKTSAPSLPSKFLSGDDPSRHTVQIIWADRDMKITRQPNPNLNQPDIYTLWKRVSSNPYRKYM